MAEGGSVDPESGSTWPDGGTVGPDSWEAGQPRCSFMGEAAGQEEWPGWTYQCVLEEGHEGVHRRQHTGRANRVTAMSSTPSPTTRRQRHDYDTARVGRECGGTPTADDYWGRVLAAAVCRVSSDLALRHRTVVPRRWLAPTSTPPRADGSTSAPAHSWAAEPIVGSGLAQLQAALDAQQEPDDWPDDVCRDASCGYWERNRGLYYPHTSKDHQ